MGRGRDFRICDSSKIDFEKGFAGVTFLGVVDTYMERCDGV